MKCSRGSCKNIALASCKLFKKQCKVVVSKLDEAFKGAVYHLCGKHANRMTVPAGWELVRETPEFAPEDDSIWSADTFAEESDLKKDTHLQNDNTHPPTAVLSEVALAETALLEAISKPKTQFSLAKDAPNEAPDEEFSEVFAPQPSRPGNGVSEANSKSAGDTEEENAETPEDNDLTVIMRHVGNDYTRPRDIPLEFQGAKRNNLIALRTGDTGVSLKKIKKSLQE